MNILTQDRARIVNTHMAQEIYMFSDEIRVKFDKDTKICVGQYPVERCEEVFKEICQTMKPMMVLQNVEVSPDVAKLFDSKAINVFTGYDDKPNVNKIGGDYFEMPIE